jgi:hypothetical protein
MGQVVEATNTSRSCRSRGESDRELPFCWQGGMTMIPRRPVPSQVLERGSVGEPLLHAAERALLRERRGCAPQPPCVVPRVPVRQPSAHRQAEPAAGEAEGRPLLVLRYCKEDGSRTRVVMIPCMYLRRSRSIGCLRLFVVMHSCCLVFNSGLDRAQPAARGGWGVAVMDRHLGNKMCQKFPRRLDDPLSCCTLSLFHTLPL